MNSFIKNFLFALLILFFLSTVFALFSQSTEREKKIPLNQVIQDIEEEKIDRILISDNY